ncbi:HlyD family secretion protein [Chloroflexota bacterium]
MSDAAAAKICLIAAGVILAVGIFLFIFGAIGSDDKETTSQQPTEIDTTVTITADGNIEALSHERLTFGSGGKVDKIFLKEGDKVNKGDVLARLDTGDTGVLELAEAQAQVSLTQAQLALTGQVLALSQAEVNVINAEIALEKVEDSWLDTISAGTSVKQAERRLEWALEEKPQDNEKIERAEETVKEAWKRFFRLASEYTEAEEVTAKEMELELAKESVKHTQQAVELARQTVELAQISLEQARKDLEEEVATIIAPFDGTVAKVGVKEGEFLSPATYTGTTIIEIIDLRYMELTARVDELDVVKVKIGQEAMVSVDAMPGMKLEGRVTFISPVAREPGVVLFEDEDEEKEYEVKIDFNITENSPIRAGMSVTAEIIVE